MINDGSFIATVKDISFAGMGVIEDPSGKVCFVSGVIPEEIVEVRVINNQKKYSFAELLKVIKASQFRVKPPCKFQGISYGNCGACSWMHISYEHQLTLKQKLVQNAFRRAQLDLVETPVIIGMENSQRYRSRTRVFVDGHKVGYLTKETQNVVDVSECLILTEPLNAKLNQLRSCRSQSHYDQKGFFEIDEQSNVQQLKLNQKISFKQTNDFQNHRLLNWLEERVSILNIPKDTQIIELFSGSGNLTKVLNHKLSKHNIYAFESDKTAVHELEKQGFSNVKAQVCDIYQKDQLHTLLKPSKKEKMLVLDPPRSGYSDLRALVSYLGDVRTIIYISCNLQSFMNDCKDLIKANYRINNITILDMFPNTPEIEILAQLDVI